MFNLKEYILSLNKTPKLVLGSFPAIVNFDYTLRDAYFDSNKMSQLALSFDEEFGLDFIRTITDLTFEAQILGAEVTFPKMAPPKIKNTPYSSVKQLTQTEYSFSKGRFQVYTSAYKTIMESTNTPLIASLTGPLTILSSLLDYEYLRNLFECGDFERLNIGLSFVTNLTCELIDELNELNPHLLMVSDPVASLIDSDAFKFVMTSQYEHIFSKFNGKTILHICGDITPILPHLSTLSNIGLSVDEKVNLEDPLKICKEKYIFGNIAPVDIMVNGTPKMVRDEITTLNALFKKYNNLIPATGCTLPYNTPHENIETFLTI